MNQRGVVMTSRDMAAIESPRTNAAAENAATVQALYGDFARRDVAAILARLADDVVWAEPANPWNPAAGTRYGHAGFLE
jgi:ketosteroid isomerase-like protein